MELAAIVRPGHKMVEVPLQPEGLLDAPALEWDVGADRLKFDTCLRADGNGGLLLSDGRKLVVMNRGATKGVAVDVAPGQGQPPGAPQEHRVLGGIDGGSSGEAAGIALYEPEVGRVVRVPAPCAASSGCSEPSSSSRSPASQSLLIALSEPYPKPQSLLLHPPEGVVVSRSRTHLQLLEPGPDRQQRVKLDAKSGVGSCPPFAVSSLWSSGAVHAQTGDVYFLDNSGASLYRWETSPGASQLSCVAQWEVQTFPDEDPKLHTVDRLAIGSTFLLAWGGRGRSFRLLRISLGSFIVDAVDLLSQSGVLFRRPKFHREVLRLSGDALYMAVFRAEHPDGTKGRLEKLFMADLAQDESAPGIEELHSIDWSSPAQIVSFSVRKNPVEEETPSFEVFCVDRRVLCARSEYFRAMFHSEMREATAGAVDVPPEVTVAAFRCLVDYLHTDLIHPVKAAGFEDVDPSKLSPPALLSCGVLCLGVAQLADRYQLLRLRRLAEAFVYAYALQLPTVLQLLGRAHALGLEDVVEACLHFVAKSWADIKSSYKRELESFVRGDPTMATVMLLRCPQMSLK